MIFHSPLQSVALHLCLISAKPGTPKVVKKTTINLVENETADRRILLFKRKRNYWVLFRLTGLSMWMLGTFLSVSSSFCHIIMIKCVVPITIIVS